VLPACSRPSQERQRNPCNRVRTFRTLGGRKKPAQGGLVALLRRCTGESGRQDLNLRPPGPQPGALPDCATPRGRPMITGAAWAISAVLAAPRREEAESLRSGRAGDGNRTRPRSLEGSCATTTLRPRGYAQDGTRACTSPVRTHPQAPTRARTRPVRTHLTNEPRQHARRAAPIRPPAGAPRWAPRPRGPGRSAATGRSSCQASRRW
jgi:hypothetical protein